jgi:hypothetical protein
LGHARITELSRLLKQGLKDAGATLVTPEDPASIGRRTAKVIIAPVTVWQSPATANIHDADLKTAADYLCAQLRTELGKDF